VRTLDRDVQINIIAAILTTGHVMNTNYEEKIPEVLKLYERYRKNLEEFI
jgi:hypothetical protein